MASAARFSGIGLLLVIATLLTPAVAQAQDATPTASPLAGVPVTLSGRPLALAPDGAKVAVLGDAGLCVIALPSAERIACADLDARGINPRREDIVWSPDSTRIAFGEQAFVTFNDGDLWVMDAATGNLTNLTDDGFSGDIMSFSNATPTGTPATAYIDTVPAWSPDGSEIAFSRSTVVDGDPRGNVIAIVPATGGDARTVVTITPDQPGILYYGLKWRPDGRSLVYSTQFTDRADPRSGVYTVDVATGEPVQVLRHDPDLGQVALIAVDATGRRALVLAIERVARAVSREPVSFVLDLDTGVLSPVEPPPGLDSPRPILLAGFSPDGNALLYVVHINDGDETLVRRGLLDDSVEIVGTVPDALPVTYVQGLQWASDGSVMLVQSLDSAEEPGKNEIVLVNVPAGSPPVATPSSATPVPPGPTALAAGATVVTNDVATLRGRRRRRRSSSLSWRRARS